jgi:hypothetical protein
MESRNRVVGIVVLLTLMSLLGGLLALRGGIGNRKPLGEGQLIHFESTSTPEDTVRQFLDGDFALIKNVESLPRPILKAYTEVGGSRPVLANPGKRFEATDFIVDNSLPRKRLIFAGVSGSRCFIHYEQGGRALSFRVAFFELTSSNTMRALWLGYCGPAKDIVDLRSQVRAGCSR